ncbi:MAG: hypothetical protein WC952_15320 [Desulfobulbaceae bacterium]|jgi:proteasome lid subunit RPN8/RPN11
MFLKYRPDARIILPENCRQGILEHCHQALEEHRMGRAGSGKAFGLVCGTVAGDILNAAACFRLKENVRSRSPYKEQVDRIMAEHAVPSETPLPNRGWVADPAELFARIRECRSSGQVLLGTYHMHRVAWEHDRDRDTPTELDEVLARDSGLLMFIVSMVRPEQPVIRAFYEGMKEKEIPIIFGSLDERPQDGFHPDERSFSLELGRLG